MIDALMDCAAQLRRAGVSVPVSATADALEALRHTDLAQRVQVRVALAATLVKRPDDLAAFGVAFDRCFPVHPPGVPPTGSTFTAAPEAEESLSDALAMALHGGDASTLRHVAKRFVDRYAGLDALRRSERYHLQRVERAADLSGALQRALAAGRDGGQRRSALDERIARAELEMRIQRLRREVRDEIRRRLADEPDRPPGRASLDEIDFLIASTTELQAMRAAVRPLARRLAAHMARRERRHRTGKVDVRRTMRRSIGSGGVPLDPATRHRRRRRPELWVLGDVSGSVAEFARFTLAFVYAMHEEFRRTRSFVFVDDIEEVTALLDRRSYEPDPLSLLVRASAPHGRRRSDYGRVLARFWDDYGAELGPTATVIVTGDARSHDFEPRADILQTMSETVRGCWFLNPEPREEWDTGDSVASLYSATRAHMAEVRNLRQLAACIADIV